MASKGSKARAKTKAAQEWTLLEKAFSVIIAVLIIVAAYAFTVKDEIVEVEAIETYVGSVDLRAGDEDYSSYNFTRQLKEDYQVRMQYEVIDEGATIRPIVHFKVWEEGKGKDLIDDTILATYDRNIRIDAEDAGTYEFRWWVEGGSGTIRVDIDVLIQPTEKIFEKRT